MRGWNEWRDVLRGLRIPLPWEEGTTPLQVVHSLLLLCVALLAAQLLFMVVTRWGDHKAPAKSLVCSALLHAAIVLGLVAVTLPSDETPETVTTVPIAGLISESDDVASAGGGTDRPDSQSTVIGSGESLLHSLPAATRRSPRSEAPSSSLPTLGDRPVRTAPVSGPFESRDFSPAPPLPLAAALPPAPVLADVDSLGEPPENRREKVMAVLPAEPMLLPDVDARAIATASSVGDSGPLAGVRQRAGARSSDAADGVRRSAATVRGTASAGGSPSGVAGGVGSGRGSGGVGGSGGTGGSFSFGDGVGGSNRDAPRLSGLPGGRSSRAGDGFGGPGDDGFSMRTAARPAIPLPVPAEAPSHVLRGVVKDAETGSPVTDGVVRIDRRSGKPLTVPTQADGRYEVSVADAPAQFAVSVSAPGFSPESRNVKAGAPGSVLQLDFQIFRTRGDVIPIEAEPVVHHVGNDKFEGRINSQFQRETEGESITANFEIPERRLSPKPLRVEFIMLAKGIQQSPKIRINGVELKTPVEGSPDDGAFDPYTVPVDPALLRAGQNRIEIEGGALKDDVDDFEYVNPRLRLIRTDAGAK